MLLNSRNGAAEHKRSNFITRERTRAGTAGDLCQRFCLPLACGAPRAPNVAGKQSKALRGPQKEPAVHHAAFDNGATKEKTATSERPANDPPGAHVTRRLIATAIRPACPRRRGEASEESPPVSGSVGLVRSGLFGDLRQRFKKNARRQKYPRAVIRTPF